MHSKSLLSFLVAVLLAVFPAFAQNAEVRIVHGINGTDIGAARELPVDVSVNGSCQLQNFQFGQVAGPLSLPAGTYAIAIGLHNPAQPCSSAPVISANVPLAAGENVTIIAHLDAMGQPTASKFVNDVSPIGPMQARLSLHHTASAPAVDVWIVQFLVDRLTRLPGVVNGQQASLDVMAGGAVRALLVASGTDLPALGPLAINPAPGDNTAVYVVGSFSNNTLGVILVSL